jgi:predicted TIM-barrel fold metal-dependent hydrolase
VQVQEKRILHASSAPHMLDEQRQMLVLALEPLATRSVNGIPLSIEEEATLVDAASQLIDRFGPDHVMLGTDYPYDMAEVDPLGLVSAVKRLPKSDRDLITGGNAKKLFKLK